MNRKANVKRETKETSIKVSVDLDGKGLSKISTGIGFLDHMLDLFSRFSGIDISIIGKGDIHVDEHHIIEDAGICLGQAIRKALGDLKGISRFGFSSAPMDDTLVQVTIDISGRPCLVFNVPAVPGRKGSFDIENTREFLKGFVNHSGLTLHINFIYGGNLHHVNEAIFKGIALALKQALRREGKTFPSTKGKID